MFVEWHQFFLCEMRLPHGRLGHVVQMVADRSIRNRLSGPVIMNIPGQAPPLGCGTQPAV